MKGMLMGFVVISFLFSGCAHTGSSGKISNEGMNPAWQFFRFYEDGLNHLSAVRAGECPMYPSCSAYSKECFRKYGLIRGWIMSCDRLMRCGRDEMKLSPKILVNGKWKCYDPVEENDLWGPAKAKKPGVP